MEPCLLTTCVGSVAELKEICKNFVQNKFNHSALSHTALVALFYFMRCSQLEHNEGKQKTKQKLAMTFCDFHLHFRFFPSQKVITHQTGIVAYKSYAMKEPMSFSRHLLNGYALLQRMLNIVIR